VERHRGEEPGAVSDRRSDDESTSVEISAPSGQTNIALGNQNITTFGSIQVNYRPAESGADDRRAVS